MNRIILILLVLFSLPLFVHGESFTYDEVVQPEKPDLSRIPTFISDLLVEEKNTEQRKENNEIEKIITNVVEGSERELDEQARALAKDSSKLNKLVQAFTPLMNKAENVTEQSEELVQALDGFYNDPVLSTTFISLSLKKATLAQALDLIASKSSLNFVLDSRVTSVIGNLRLTSVSIAQALKTILALVHPEQVLWKEGNVYRIINREKADELFKRRKLSKKEETFEKKSFLLHHITLSESSKIRLEKMWNHVAGSDQNKTGVYVTFDDASKKVFYRGRAKQCADFENYLREIDVATAQVNIEARIVIANKDFEESFGVQWSNLYNRRASIHHGMSVIGSGPLDNINNAPTTQTLTNLMDWAFNFFPDTGLLTRNVHIPLVFGGNDLTTKRLNLVLNAAENRNELKTILKPSIVTNHGEEAEILVGQNVPIQTEVKETIEGSLRDITTVTYKDVGTKLKVRPFVSPDKKTVFLDLYVENSSQMLQGQFPLITTTRSKNRVMLKNGQTTMIGGLIEDTHQTTASKLPFVGDLPIIGWFFKGSRKTVVDHQMMIFITPTIV